MFNKGKQREIPTKQAKKVTLILLQSLALNFERLTNDVIKEDTDFIKEVREYVIQILDRSEFSLMTINNELINRGELNNE